ncbi:N-acetylglucosamine-6-phosphate deacetylase [Segniliparus rugosus ATCC BAA-974]|uniref:N-acetylglucosamine-6-phosphate deacetylase n=1 Tax=Segniliparus rugosus (strain ATCC BAA-974 / DSM 45345 / CCUG 50838 / CIP 108380 / JCM 13579 / CDC 945) TaxID=679197 RepID=E5XNP2_SEGRC|nr:N-acetylglucosamine-6-phosphate deacetylase [Segniliparus rugosus ATCC BAA-974]
MVFTVRNGAIAQRQAFEEWSRAWPKAVPPTHLGRLFPGLVDIHCHGGGGHTFCTTDPDEARKAAEFHHRSGSTTVVASLVTASEEVLQAQIRALRPLADEGVIAGIHLEGPFLAASRCGAQDPRYLVPPDPSMTRRLLETGEGTVVMMTLAPELLGADEVVSVLDDAGVTVAFGHTAADYATFRRALDAPKPRVVTHLGNGMAPMHHRAPGPVGAVLHKIATDGTSSTHIELIADGQHVADQFVAMLAAVGGEVVLVSDAMAASGMPDGPYRLGELDVVVQDGVARLANGSLAGSTSALADIARRSPMSLGALARYVGSGPAEALGLADIGELLPGSHADFVVLDEDRGVRQVMRRGEWLS